ncbi:MAG TPA: phosphosulfolactate synthase [Limnochordales bacterium]
MVPPGPTGDARNPLLACVSYPISGRETKPRTRGLTMVIDKGLGLAKTHDLLETAADYIDFVKLAFGTAVLYPPSLLARKIELIRAAGVDVYPGGTLLEAAVLQGTAARFLAVAREVGFTYIEVSEGTIELAADVRGDLIRRALDMGFGVVTEVGKKDPSRPLAPTQVAEQAERDLAAGAFKVIIEGRDAGRNVGIYGPEGEIREALLESIVAALGSIDDVIWEAPQSGQQRALLLKFGPRANFGNVQPDDVVTLEAMRVGLRGDTLRRCVPANVG